MSLASTTKLSSLLAVALKSALQDTGTSNKGFIYIYSGTVPATADAVVTGVILAKISKDGDGTTTLTFTTPTTGSLIKTAAEVWKCLGASVVSGTPTFYRWCCGTDDGLAADDTKTRLQGLVGNDLSASQLALGTATVATGTDVVVDLFQYTFPNV